MRIEIIDGGDKITLSNDELDNDNFVDIWIKGQVLRAEMTVPIEELYSAVKAFYEMRERRLKTDKLR